MDDAELNAIRAARLAELQKSSGNGASSAAGSQGQPQDDVKASVLSRVLEPAARERLSRVRMVRPDRAESVEQYIVKLYSMGQINRKLTEKDVVEILDGVSRDSNKQSSTKIIYDRKHSTMGLDDDDEEEEDDFFD